MAPQSKFSRRTIIAAADVLKVLGHSGFNRALMEFALPNEQAGTGSGLLARANSLAKYALDNPEIRTADGAQIGDAIVDRAARLAVSPNANVNDRRIFEDALGHDGFIFDASGKLITELALGGEREESGMTGASITVSGPDLVKLKGAVAPSMTKPTKPLSRQVFIVHGHDRTPREAVARFLERLGFDVIILQERANKNQTIIEKIEANADVSFAVVLLTPDDQGGALGETPRPRARQNVLLELGYFMGRLGRENVCVLRRGDVEIPTDFAGVIWTEFDEHDAWKQKLARELREAKFDIDLNKIHP